MRVRRADTATGDLFEVPQAPAHGPGSLDYDAELRHLLSDALKRTPLSRYEVAARMSELTGQSISKEMLDAWTAESKTPWRFPFQFAAAFEVACDTTCLQDLLARKRGCRVLVGREALLAEYGRIRQQQDELSARERALRQLLRSKP